MTMRQPSRIDWRSVAVYVGIVVVVFAVDQFMRVPRIMYGPSKPEPDLTEVITHVIRLENDLVDMDRRVGRLEILEATGKEE